MAGRRNVVRQDVVQIGFEVDQAPINRLERSLNDVQSNAMDLANTADRAAEEVSRIGTEATEAARSADRLRNSGFRAAEEDAEGAAEAARRYSEETERARRESERFGNETRSGSEDSGEAIEGLTAGVGELTSAFAGVAAAFAVGQIISSVAEVEQAINRLEAQTGATAAEMEVYSEAVNSLYTSGNGESIGDVANSMALVNQQFKDLDTDIMERITNNAMVLSDTFDMDLNETLRGVNALMTNMGLTADEAFDYIAKGAQNGLDKSHELTDNIAEYSQLWAQAGFSAEEMFTILQNGLDSGAYNLDKVNDFVKEFTISLSDGRIEENIDKFSEGTQQVFEQWQNGSATQKDVFNSIINDLGNMTNEQEALTTASTVWSALGEDNAMKVITSLTAVNDTYGNVKNTMQSINDIRYDDIGSSFEKVSRSASTALNQLLAPAVNAVNDAISSGLEWVTEFAKEHETLATGIGAAAVAATALSVGIGVAVAAAHFVPPVIAKITASMTALNMSLGAVGIAITAVSAGIGIFAALMSDTEEEVEAYDGTLAECREEIERTEAAHKKAAERYGKNSEAAKDLEKDLDKLNAQYEAGGGSVAEYMESVEETTNALNELRTSQDKAMTSIENSEISGLQAVSMLEALSEKANLTSTDLDVMSEYADYLNDTFNCNIVVDYDTGELTGFDPKVITQQIIDSANDKRVQAAMDYLSNPDFISGYIEQAKLLRDIDLVKIYSDSAIENFNLSEQIDPELLSMSRKELDELAKTTKASFEAANVELETYGSIIDETGEFTDNLRDSMDEVVHIGGEFVTNAKETTEATEEINDGMSEAQEAVSAYNDELFELANAYDEALVAAQESVAGQYAVWEEVGDLAETSVSDIQGALQSQSEYWGSYADNLATLQEKVNAIRESGEEGSEELANSLSNMLASMSDGSEDSAAALAALAGATDEQLTSVVGDWQSVKDKQDEASANMALTQTEFQTKLSAMGTDMQGFVDKMDMTTEATTNASNTINAFIDTMVSTINDRKSEVTTALSGLMSAASQYNLNVSAPTTEVQQNATGTTYSDDVFISGEEGAELIVGKKGSTVFPASETDKIINAVQDYTGGYSPKQSSRSNGNVIRNETTYAPQFTLNLNGASATNENKRTVKRWIKESLKEVFNNFDTDNSPIIEI